MVSSATLAAVPRRDLAHEVAQAAADAASPSADREDDGRLPLGRDDDVRRARGAVEEVPRGELPLLVLDDERALAGQHEECLLGVLAVVHPDPLARPEDVEVDAEVREPPLPLEVAVGAQRAHLAPSGVPRVDDEPSLPVDDGPVLRVAHRRLGHDR